MSNASKGFGITSGKGFHITFANGHTVSIQFGPGNYGDNYDLPISREGDVEAGKLGSQRAEVAAWNSASTWHELNGDGGDILGYQTPDQVLAVLNRIAALSADAVIAKAEPILPDGESA